jgi:hypothetical protein
MEEAIGVKYDYRGQLVGKRAVVRYADDFVCFCETKEDAQAVQTLLSQWLAERGLTLSEEKTRIVHLIEGFDFLSFNIRHYPAPQTSKTGWKLLIKPNDRKAGVQNVENRSSMMKSCRFTTSWLDHGKGKIATTTWHWFTCSATNRFTRKLNEPCGTVSSTTTGTC